ncbi:MAG: O-antigen ligase family protein [Candidatus Magasanikbacteria bacterium]|nr:O-antigen ligase family protein [Candidatus Magasanikbacteria bacterium]
MSLVFLFFFILFIIFAWKRFFWACFLVILLLPSYLVRFSFGQIPTTFLELMIGIIFIFWLIRLFNEDNRKLAQNRAKKLFDNHKSLLFAIGIFVIGAVINITISIDLRSALGEFKAFYVEPIIFAFILYTSIEDKKQVNNLIFALVLSGFATAILAIYQHFTGFMVPYSFWENRDTYRVTGWWGFPNGVGIYLAPIIPLAIYLFVNYKNKIIQTTSLLFVPLALLAIFYAKSTGALIGVLAGLFFLLLFNKFTKISVIIASIAVFLFVMFAPMASGIKQEILLQDRSGQLRINMWGETVELLRHNPIFGVGLASYQKAIYPYRIDKWIEIFHHPHNQFLTMWVNIGIVGLFGFILILFWFFKTAFKNKNIFLLSAMIVFVIIGLVDSPYIKNDMAIIFWLLPTFLLLFNEKG